uniref:UBC core domain-containing protein n=1 Tax=Glossina brevipalpis TaxID=37001 RepID=A0A1A9WGU4_9MUSC
MVSPAASRVMREFKEQTCDDAFAQNPNKLELVNDCWTELRGEITGPMGTPYEGGKFQLEIKVPERYPFAPPSMRFITKIWHPNISSVTGAICLDILKDNWAAAMTLRTVLLSLQALLDAAEPDDPQDAVVAHQYKHKRDMFEMTARHWTNVYAGGPHINPDCDKKVQFLEDAGINEHEARAILSKENWCLKKAYTEIFS